MSLKPKRERLSVCCGQTQGFRSFVLRQTEHFRVFYPCNTFNKLSIKQRRMRESVCRGQTQGFRYHVCTSGRAFSCFYIKQGQIFHKTEEKEVIGLPWPDTKDSDLMFLDVTVRQSFFAFLYHSNARQGQFVYKTEEKEGIRLPWLDQRLQISCSYVRQSILSFFFIPW